MRLLVLSAALALASSAAAKDLTITVAAGKHDRTNTPVCVPLSLPDVKFQGNIALLRRPDGSEIVGQVTPPGLLTEATPAAAGEKRLDLHFLLPSLKAGESATFRVVLGAEVAAKDRGFEWICGDTDYLAHDKKYVLRYMNTPFDDSTKDKRVQTYKVFHHVYDFDGKALLTDWGADAQFPHHRGLFYGFKATYGDGKGTTADTWHCPPPPSAMEAHLAHEKTLSASTGPVLGRHRVQIGWHGKNKERFAVEERELTAYAVPGGHLLQFASKLTPTKGTVKLDGDPQHAGFHFRASREVSEKTAKQTYYLRPDGKDEPGKTRNWEPKTKKGPVDLPWNAMSFVVKGERYTAAYLDRPENPKEARFSERDYGRFGSYFVAECTAAKPVLVGYRLWIQQGEMTVPGAAAKAADFAEAPAVTIKYYYFGF